MTTSLDLDRHSVWRSLQRVADVEGQRTIAVFQVYVTPAEATAFRAAVADLLAEKSADPEASGA